jgi:SSS family solute:Na+ symporter
VLIYTMFGGMWSVAFTDLFQTVVILIGLSLVAWLVGDLAGGFEKGDRRGPAQGKFNILPAEMTRRAGGPWPAPSWPLPSARSRSRTCSSA